MDPELPIDPWFHRVPKVELHLHLEGAIPLPALWTLVQKYGGAPDTPDPAALAAKFTYRDFPHFIETWVWKNQFLREYEDFTFIAESVARDLAAQNIRYVEAFFSPGDFARVGLQPGELARAVRGGLDLVPEIEVGLVPDLIRDFGPERGARVLEEVHEARECGILGVGIGGSEQSFPPEPWAAVFERARALGFRTSCHAGEAAGPESVWGALRALRPDRIGHGTRVFEDARLAQALSKLRVPVELCPLSNVATGAVSSYAAHPVRRFFDSGIPVSINTDDPQMFGNRLFQEFAFLEAVHGFSRVEIRELLLAAISASWTSDQRKMELTAAFVADPAWND